MNRREPVALSREGTQRRGEILRLAEGALTDRVRTRRARKALAAAAMVVALAAIVAPLARTAMLTGEPAPGPTPRHAPTPVDFASLDLPYRFEIIDDQKLTAELAALGAGVIRVAGDVQRLVSTDGSPFVQPKPVEVAEPDSSPGAS